MSASDPTVHPVVPGKTCVKCGREPVTRALLTKYVTYYNCSACTHQWSEPHPNGMTLPDTWAPLRDTDS
jgi:hypothetical protein